MENLYVINLNIHYMQVHHMRMLSGICLVSFHHQISFILDTALSGVRLQHIWTMYEFTAGH